MIIFGVLFFMFEVVKCYYNDFFWVKMCFFGLVILFIFMVCNCIIGDIEFCLGFVFFKIVVVFFILLWSGVVWGGWWIGFWG